MLDAIAIRKDSKMNAESTISFMDTIVEMWVEEGFICFIVVNSTYGHLCGHVVVPPDHPVVNHMCSEAECTKYDVHGGVTSSEIWPLGGWLVGFDCNHFGRDYAPYFPQPGRDPSREKGRAYVKRQVSKLAKQLKQDYTPTR